MRDFNQHEIEGLTMRGIADFLTQRNAEFDGIDGLQPVTAASRRALEVYRKFNDELQRAANDPNLSSVGRKNGLLEFAKKNASEIVRANKAAERAKSRLAERRANFQRKLPAVDKTDANSAAIQRQICDRLYQMSPGERKVFLAGALDPITCQAILEAPLWLSGVTADQRDGVLNAAVEAAQPGALQRLARDADAVQVLEHSARVLTEHFAEILDIPPSALPDFLNSSVPNQQHIEADVERATEPLAA